MALGIFAILSGIALAIWTGIKDVSQILIEFVKVVLTTMYQFMNWVNDNAPRPVKFVFFIILILLVGNTAISFFLGMNYDCVEEELREYETAGAGVLFYFKDFVSSTSNTDLITGVSCKALGNVTLRQDTLISFNWKVEGTTFLDDNCSIYCRNKSQSFQGIESAFDWGVSDTYTCKSVCVELYDNNGDLIFIGCPMSEVNMSTNKRSRTTPVGNISKTTRDVFTISCSSSDNLRLKVFKIDWLAYELWLFIGLIALIIQLKRM